MHNNKIRSVILLCLTLMLPVSALAQAWFGLSLPVGIGDPHSPSVDVSRAQPLPPSVPAGEEAYGDLRGEVILTLVERIVGFSRESRAEGNRVWGRVTGFDSLARTTRWVAEEFRAAGLQQVTVQDYAGEGAFWWPRDWEVRLLASEKFGPGSTDIVLESAFVTSGSDIPGGSLTAPLVFAGHISEPLLAGDVNGKVAVQVLTPETGAYSERTPTRERAQALMAAGAVAVINVVEQTGNMHTRDFSNCNGPCFNIGTDDGRFLQQVIAAAAQQGLAGDLQVRLQVDAAELTGLSGQNALGIIPGRSPYNIIINAHADGWYDAAGDNADGLAVLIAMARHFARPEHRVDATLVFVASGGHHSTGLNGPANFVAMNPALVANTALVVNLEHIAQLAIDSSDWRVGPEEQEMNFSITNGSPLLTEIATTGIERYGFNLNPEFRREAPGDLGGYRPLGVAMVQAIHSGPMYHASGDVLDTISVPGLERAARFYTWFVSRAAQADPALINP
ncbi:MAG: hypothetical protein RLZZ385_1337 [Pseudomonadota bacterium]|jgi:hypothetical protein